MLDRHLKTMAQAERMRDRGEFYNPEAVRLLVRLRSWTNPAGPVLWRVADDAARVAEACRRAQAGARARAFVAAVYAPYADCLDMLARFPEGSPLLDPDSPDFDPQAWG